jgi:hypothetical protein
VGCASVIKYEQVTRREVQGSGAAATIVVTHLELCGAESNHVPKLEGWRYRIQALEGSTFLLLLLSKSKIKMTIEPETMNIH